MISELKSEVRQDTESQMHNVGILQWAGGGQGGGKYKYTYDGKFPKEN